MPSTNITYKLFESFLEICNIEFTFGEALDSTIRTCQKSSLLLTALEIKCGRICDGNEKERMNFCVANICELLLDHNIDRTCNLLRYALIVQENSTQYEILLRYIFDRLSSANDFDEEYLLNLLKLLRVSIEIVNQRTEWLEILEHITKDAREAILKLTRTSAVAVNNFCSTYILPQYLQRGINFFIEDAFLQTFNDENLSSLCYLLHFLTDKEYKFFLQVDDSFWKNLQQRLVSSRGYKLKQILYILKKFLILHEFHPEFYRGQLITTGSETVWENFIILVEVLQEKQLHLVEPSYKLLSTLEILDCSWKNCLYIIILNHSHISVKAFGLKHIFSIGDYNFSCLFECILSALNYNEHVINNEIWDAFKSFLHNLNEQDSLLLLQLSNRVCWLPAVAYRFYNCIFLSNWRPNCRTIVENIYANIDKIPHSFIRTHCIKMFEEYLIKYCVFNFEDFLRIGQMLRGTEKSKLLKCNFYKYRADVKDVIKTWRRDNYEPIKTYPFLWKLLEERYFKDVLLELSDLFVKENLKSEVLDQTYLILCMNYKALDQLPQFLNKWLENAAVHEELILKVHPLLINIKEKTQFLFLYNKCLILIDSPNISSLQRHIAYVLLIGTVEPSSKRSLVDNWTKRILNSGKNKLDYKICRLYIQFVHDTHLYSSNINSNEVANILSTYEVLMESCSYQVTAKIVSHLRNGTYLSYLDTTNTEKFITTCFKNVLELKRTDLFKRAIVDFIGMLYNIRIDRDIHLLQLVVNYTTKLWDMTPFDQFIGFSLTKNIELCYSHLKHFIGIIVEMLLFGGIFKTHQRAEYSVCQEIYSKELENFNPNLDGAWIRIGAMQIIRNYVNDKNIHVKHKRSLADEITSLLLGKYLPHAEKRYFINSQVHFQKVRILQGLLFVCKYIDQRKASLVDFLSDLLCSESHQQNVKFYIQWLLIVLLNDNTDSLSFIKIKVEHTGKIRSTAVVAFIPVLYHLAKNKHCESFWLDLMTLMVQWTMGPHFNLRLQAQECVFCLYEEAKRRSFTSVVNQFQTWYTCLRAVLDATEKRIDCFYRFVYDKFDAFQHLNQRCIYYDSLLISEITEMEYENYEYLMDDVNEHITFNLPESFSKLQKQYISKSTPLNNADDSTTIQKKLTLTWPETSSENKNSNEFVVVASLIDKLPNLGGLSRTCEVFGVGQLVINTRNYVNESDFKNVSMSSEKWVQIVEVKMNKLRDYLLDMKNENYCIVGAEQTSNSVKLNEFRFPKKCVLLLGNEKEGISPNLLPLVDYCVEIPQCGMVRSLNVHVAGATFIWEYSKQHELNTIGTTRV